MNAYGTAKTIAATLVSGSLADLTSDKIREAVENACTLPQLAELTSSDRERLVRELETTYQTVIGEERALVGREGGWQAWLPERKARLSWGYWTRYRDLLARGPMNDDVRKRLDESTDKVLGFLGDPERESSWDRRGLVVGLVQSGKTSHYIGLVNKAVDAGYKVVVILTGFTESLRVQTQIRAEEGFLGYSLAPVTKRGELRSHLVGVGTIAPGKKPDSVTTRHNDFRRNVADNLGIHVGGNEILFAIKKNAGVLRNLIAWIQASANATDSGGRQFVKHVPLLVVDDESDVGSIDTRKGSIVDDDPDPEHEPARINELIRRLLTLFDQSAYVGYTATPFANVLIHDGGWTKDLGDDLFPRDFILSLPTPSDHVGPGMVFGLESPEREAQDGLPIVVHIPAEESEGEKAWIPAVHKKHHQPIFEGRREVPASLREAILDFVLVCAARRLRKTGTRHNSMLVHVTRFNDVQQCVEDQIKRELGRIVDRLRAKTAHEKLVAEFRRRWEGFTDTTRKISEREGSIFKNPTHEWREIEAELFSAASAIQIRTINGLAGDVLDYETHVDDGLHIIAVGGDKLARGLTLEGLSVSYFLRCSRMYDTLMQMGRWFGYRPGYLDLCRLYTTSDLCDWFSHIANATEELRNEFDLMVNSGGTPKEFGLRVRSHPQLMVTSQVKMRHGQTIPVTFQGSIVETISFYRDAATVENNWRAAGRLVEDLDAGGGIRKPNRDNRVQWADVPAAKVLAFLNAYKEHESGTKVRTPLLTAYVEKELQRGRLSEWTVLISGGSKESDRLGGVDIRLVDRRWKFSGDTEEKKHKEKEQLIARNQYRIGVLINPPDEAVDLEAHQVAVALEETIADWKRDPKGRKKVPTDPAGRFLRQMRDPSRGLLILYPLDAKDEKTETGKTPVIAFAISFPGVAGDTASTVTYTVNNVYQQQELSFD